VQIVWGSELKYAGHMNLVGGKRGMKTEVETKEEKKEPKRR